VPGMIFTIEPMINAGRRDIKEDRKGNRPYDGWTIVTRDRSLSAQWEHTVLVTDTGYEVLTGLSAGSPPPPAFAPPATAAAHALAAPACVGDGAWPPCRRAASGPAEPVAVGGRDARRVPRPARRRCSSTSRASRAPRRAAAALRGLARHVDATLCELWQPRRLPPGGAGGRGRLRPRRTVPVSDVDVLVLLPEAGATPSRHKAVEAFITACWDVGLEIGSSVRTVDECLAEARAT
jgi:hypothetical protein